MTRTTSRAGPGIPALPMCARSWLASTPECPSGKQRKKTRSTGSMVLALHERMGGRLAHDLVGRIRCLGARAGPNLDRHKFDDHKFGHARNWDKFGHARNRKLGHKTPRHKLGHSRISLGNFARRVWCVSTNCLSTNCLHKLPVHKIARVRELPLHKFPNSFLEVLAPTIRPLAIV